VTFTVTDNHGGVGTAQQVVSVQNVLSQGGDLWVGTSPSGGTYTFSSPATGQILVTGQGASVSPYTVTGRLVVFGGAGNDTFTVNAAPAGGATLDGGDGSDSYTVQLGGLAGAVAVTDTGTTGIDRITVNGTAAADALFKAGTIKWKPAGAAGDYQETVTFSGIDSNPSDPTDYTVVLNAGAGDDTVLDPDSGNLLILGGAGNDTITIASTTGPVTADGGDGSDSYLVYGGSLQGPVTISDSGTTGTNAVTVYGTSGADTISQSGSQVTVNGGAPITLGPGVGGLTVDGGGGTGDTFTASGAPSIVPTVTGVADAVVYGTAGDDKIQIKQGAQAGQVAVWVNGTLAGTYASTDHLTVHGLAGNDDIQADGNVTVSLWLYGDAGDDRLKGGGGSNVLVGGDGDDLLVGGGGRDLLIGGAGADRLIGNGGDDILVGGTTSYDLDPSALGAIMAEWTSGHDFATRTANLTDTGTGLLSRLNGDYFLLDSGTGQTVFNDASHDTLTGSAGSDWYFAGLADQVTGLTALDLAFIFGV
jgi:Ca2+-binding RTX toxin-like protein